MKPRAKKIVAKKPTAYFYVYVLESEKDGKRYIGYTLNLLRRLEEHREGKGFSTEVKLPIRLIYFEACATQEDAEKREKYLKTTRGKQFLKKHAVAPAKKPNRTGISIISKYRNQDA